MLRILKIHAVEHNRGKRFGGFGLIYKALLKDGGVELPLCVCLDASQEVNTFFGYPRGIQMIERAKQILFCMGYKFIGDA